MNEFNPLNVSENLKELYKDFITTSFPIKNLGIKRNLEKIIKNENLLWNGPYISVASKYRKGENAKIFLENIGFDEAISNSINLDQLFKHQEEGIKSILDNNHTIVSTGTGSGKTESFILPILDHCIKNKNKGLKAIIVYPMNALANDQVLRLRTLLYHINANLEEPIRIAKYTGQTPTKASDDNLSKIPPQKCKLDKSIFLNVDFPNCPNNCDQLQIKAGIIDKKARLYCKNNEDYKNDFEIITREEIRNDPPDILITNYVQLEYLLLRREDSNLFKSLETKFLVFDELHWYSGATGSEVALLIRRLKSRIQKYSKNDIVCIGTSATISSTSNAHEDIAKFGTSIFGERISPENVILGEYEKNNLEGTYLPLNLEPIPIFTREEIFEMNETDFTKYINYFGDLNSDLSQIDNRIALMGSLLSKNKFFKDIVDTISASAKSIDGIIEEYSSNNQKFEKDKNYLKDLIWSYLYTGSLSLEPHLETSTGNEYLIKPQVHIFFRSIGENWPHGEIHACLNCGELFSKEYAICSKCGFTVEELCVCRFCGEEFYKSFFNPNPLDKSLGVKSAIGLETTINAERVDNDDFYQIFQTFAQYENFSKQKKCLNCGSLNSENNKECVFCNSKQLNEIFISEKIHNCPSCGRSYGNSSAISSMYISPNSASKVVFDLNYILLPDKERKMIVFSDSRQDASYMAGTIKYEHLNHLMRQIVAQTVKSRGKISYYDLEMIVIPKIQSMYSKMDEEEIRRALLLEVSSKVGSQRSTENLGLISIFYSFIDNLNLTQISNELNIDETDFKNFLTIILDFMRQDGALEGLQNVKASRSPPVGYTCERNYEKTYNIKNILPNSKTPNKFSKVSQKIFPENNVLELLEKSFAILKENNYIKELNVGIYANNTQIGYLVSQDKLVFDICTNLYKCDTCGRLYSKNIHNKCPGWRCNGELIAKDIEEHINSDDNFYLEFYNQIKPVKLEVEEDTGFISIEKRQKRELAFRTGKVDILVATPTLELGIDIGDLSCVGLMKSPPSPANYVQRVGRAGRSSKISMANAFMFQNPIDLYYFDNPHELISGNVKAPVINISNTYIVEKQINSLILEELFVNPSEKPIYYTKNVEKFIEENNTDDMISQLNQQKSELIDLVKKTFPDIQLDNAIIQNIIDSFETRFYKALIAYQHEIERFEETIEEIKDEQRKNRKSRSKDAINNNIRLRRMESNIEYRLWKLFRRDLFSQLSKEGFIPRYAFPGSSVKIFSQDGKEYDERQMPLALYELCPGMPVYLNGMKNRVIGLPFTQEPDIRTTSFYYCDNCGIYAKELEFDECPQCGEKNTSKEIKECYNPSAIVIKEEGRPSSEGREHVFANSEVFLLDDLNNSNDHLTSKNSLIDEIILLKKVSLLTVVSGILDYNKNAPESFNFCEKCGFYVGGDFSIEENCNKNHMDVLGKDFHQPESPLKDVNLYHTFDTSAMIINLPLIDENAIISFKNALINASQRIVGADDGEIDGIVKDNTLILYDNVEGGTGYVNTIYETFDEIIRETVLLLLKCNCQKGCLKCLYSYRRRIEIPSIDKRKIIHYSKSILFKRNIIEINKFRTFEPGDDQSKAILNDYGIRDAPELYSKIKVIDDASIMRDLILASQKVIIITPSISEVDVEWIDDERSSWSDILVSCKANGLIDLKLYLKQNENELTPSMMEKLDKWNIESYFLEDYELKMGKRFTLIMVQNDESDPIMFLSDSNLSNIAKKPYYAVFLNNTELFTTLPEYLATR